MDAHGHYHRHGLNVGISYREFLGPRGSFEEHSNQLYASFFMIGCVLRLSPVIMSAFEGRGLCPIDCNPPVPSFMAFQLQFISNMICCSLQNSTRCYASSHCRSILRYFTGYPVSWVCRHGIARVARKAWLVVGMWVGISGVAMGCGTVVYLSCFRL